MRNKVQEPHQDRRLENALATVMWMTEKLSERFMEHQLGYGREDYVKDLALGGTIGAVTGSIGLGGASATASIASKVGTEVGKPSSLVVARWSEQCLALRPRGHRKPFLEKLLMAIKFLQMPSPVAQRSERRCARRGHRRSRA